MHCLDELQCSVYVFPKLNYYLHNYNLNIEKDWKLEDEIDKRVVDVLFCIRPRDKPDSLIFEQLLNHLEKILNSAIASFNSTEC